MITATSGQSFRISGNLRPCFRFGQRKVAQPDALTVRAVIDNHHGSGRPVFCFNYEQPQTTLWRNGPEIEARYGANARLSFDSV